MEKELLKLVRTLNIVPGIEANQLMRKEGQSYIYPDDTVVIFLKFRDVEALNTFLWAGSYRYYNIVNGPHWKLKFDYTDASPVNTFIEVTLLGPADKTEITDLTSGIEEFVNWYTSLDGILAKAKW